MLNIFLFFFYFSALIANAVLAVFILIFIKKYKSPVILTFAKGFIFYNLFKFILFYQFIFPSDDILVTRYFYFFAIMSISMLVIFSPQMITTFYPSKYDTKLEKFFLGLFIIGFIFLILAFYPALSNPELSIDFSYYILSIACRVLMALYIIFRVAWHYLKETDPLLIRTCKEVISINSLFLFAFIYDFWTFYINANAGYTIYPHFGFFLYSLLWVSRSIQQSILFVFYRESFPLFIQPNPQLLDEHGLTKREKEVVAYMLNGMSNSDIAEHLFVSLSTIKQHSKNIFQKLNINSRMELVALFYRTFPKVQAATSEKHH